MTKGGGQASRTSHHKEQDGRYERCTSLAIQLLSSLLLYSSCQRRALCGGERRKGWWRWWCVGDIGAFEGAQSRRMVPPTAPTCPPPSSFSPISPFCNIKKRPKYRPRCRAGKKHRTGFTYFFEMELPKASDGSEFASRCAHHHQRDA